MAVGTRTVLALIGGAVLTVGIYLHASGRESAGLGAMAVGFGTAAGWAFLGMELAQRGEIAAPARTYLSGGMAAITLAMYFGLRSRDRARGE